MLHLQVAGDVRPLADGLATVLAEPLADPFAREWIGVPTDGMQRWLKLHLAHRLGTSGAGHGDGVVANLDVRYPGTLRQVVLAAARQDPDTGGDRVDPGAADPWRPEHLVWAVLELLRTDPDPARFGPLATLPDGATWFGRALRVAQLFDHYAVRRPDLLLDWAGDRAVDTVGAPLGDADRWQFALWRAARDRLGVPSPPELVAGVLPGVRAGTVDLALPPRLAVFGLTTLPYGAPFLDLLDAVATHRDVHVFLLDPSAPASARVRAAVLDDEHRPVPRRAHDRTDAVVAHPLLRSWGRPYRERTVLLARAEDHGVAPATRIGTDATDGAGTMGTPATLLARLQHDLRTDRAPDATFTPPPGDRSLQVHSCHGPTRQVEVLRDALLHLLADDPTLREDDIVVCCPDLETYAPLVEAGFGPSALRGGGAPVSAADSPPRLAYSVADRSLREAYPTLVALDALLGLAAGRATATAVLEFLALAPVRLRFGLDDEALATVGAWTAETNVRWGFDGAHRARWGLPAGFTLNSWRAALDRLLLGVAVSDDDLALTVGDIAPLGVEGTDIETVGRLAEVVALLADTAADFATPRTAAEWSEALRAVADRAFAVPRGEAWQRDRLHRIVDALATDSVVAGHPVEVPLDLADVRRFLADRLDGVPTRADWFRGGVTVTSLTPMRGLPFRVVAILGFDDVARGAAPDGDDLGARHPRVGDRDPRTETRQALLDAVLAAGDHLVITRTGHDVRTNRTQPYGVALAELRDVVVATMAPEPTGGPPPPRPPRRRARPTVRHLVGACATVFFVGAAVAGAVAFGATLAGAAALFAGTFLAGAAVRWARGETDHPHQAIDTVNLPANAPAKAAGWTGVERVHPHQAFDEANLTAGTLGVEGPFTFDPQARSGAEARRDRSSEAAPFLAEPLAQVDDLRALDPPSLQRFFREPVAAFLRSRLGLHLPRDDEAVDDDLVLSLHASAEWRVGDRIVRSRLAGADPEAENDHERALGTLPPGTLGNHEIECLSATVDNLVAAASATGLDPSATRDVTIDLTLGDGTRIVGAVTVCDGRGDPGPMRVTYSTPKPRQELEAWIDLMLLVAQEPDSPWRSIVVRRAEPKRRAGAPKQPSEADVCTLMPTSAPDPRAAALAALETIVAVYRVGMCEPIPLFPSASKGIHREASSKSDWNNFNGFGDGTRDTTVIAFGECSLDEILALPVAAHDPGGPEEGASRAVWYANLVWGTVESTCTGLHADASGDDTEDGEGSDA